MTVPLALLLVGLSVVVGGILGLAAGFFGRWLDETVMRLTDLVMAFPIVILPMVVGPVLILASLDIGTATLLLSGLSFLGLGAKPPTAEWGSMVSTAVQNFDSGWMGVFPAWRS